MFIMSKQNKFRESPGQQNWDRIARSYMKSRWWKTWIFVVLNEAENIENERKYCLEINLIDI